MVEIGIYDLIVIGSGPAGLVASLEARKRGANLALIDGNFKAGGQLFKQVHKFFGSTIHYAGVRGFRIAEKLLRETKDLEIEVLLNSEIVGLFDSEKNSKTLAVSYEDRIMKIIAKRLVISTGARENVIPFTGWTLPGVIGAGAAQTMMNIWRVMPGKKVLMVGAGNVGLIVAYQLIQAGVKVVAIIEAMPRIGGWAVHAAKVLRLGVPILTSHTIKEVLGKEHVEKAVITQLDEKFRTIPGTEKTYDVDCVCLAVGLTPNTELTRLAKCEHIYVPILGGWIPLHNEEMKTTVKGIYVAGDVAGIEEASVAMEEGRLAGISVAASLDLVELNEAKDLQKTIWNNLDELRSGPFGEKRREAKYKILLDYKRR